MDLIQQSQTYVHGGTQKDHYTPDEVIAVDCPLCGSTRRQQIYTEHGSIGISRCQDCTLIFTSPRIHSPEKIYWGDAKLYEEEARLIFEGKAPHHRDPNYREELSLIKRYKPSGKFLDVGCNLGMLLRLAAQMGWEAHGVEPSASLAGLASKHRGVTIHNCFLNELPKSQEGTFDVVALSDVLEHISDPIPFLKQASRYLAKDGLLYVKVPNGRWNLFKQHAAAALGRRPDQGIWDSYEHVVHYSDKTLRQMLRKGGFEPLRLTIAKPVQTPVWHEYVGHYYQYPSPWAMDWKRVPMRSAFYWLSWGEIALRLGSVGILSPNIVALAKRSAP